MDFKKLGRYSLLETYAWKMIKYKLINHLMVIRPYRSIVIQTKIKYKITKLKIR